MTDWKVLLNTKRNFSTVSSFATGKLSGRGFYSAFSETSGSGAVRNLLRDHGVEGARTLARKALYRRSPI
jgi:hypothetical protein